MHVTLSCVYAERNAHGTALLVHRKNSFWGTETKNTVKDKCGISLAKDTSADAVFCLVPVLIPPPPLFTPDPAECLCQERPCPSLAASMNRVGQRDFIAQEAEKSLNQGHCPALQGKLITGLCFIKKLMPIQWEVSVCVRVHACTHMVIPLSTFLFP